MTNTRSEVYAAIVPEFAPFQRDFPVFKLTPSVPVSDEFRAEMDDWLRRTFGHRRRRMVAIMERHVLLLNEDTLVMHPTTAKHLRSAVTDAGMYRYFAGVAL